MTPDDDPPVSDANPILYTEVERAERRKVYDASDPASVRKMEVDAELRSRVIRDFYREVFSTDIGRLAMWDILMAAHAFDAKFGTASGLPHPEYTWFEAGKQALGHELYISWMVYDFEGVQQMLRENQSDLKAAAKEQAKPAKRQRRKSPLTQM